MPTPVLVIVNGLPCTGKTTVGRCIAARCGLPFLHKDAVKEILFDTLGWKDRRWSKSASVCAFEMLFLFIATLAKTGTSLIVEGNFRRSEHGRRFEALCRQFETTLVEVLCRAEGRTLWQRFRQRAASGSRHPGHVDEQTFEELKPQLLQGRSEPLGIAEDCFEVDTTDFAAIDLTALIEHIESLRR